MSRAAVITMATRHQVFLERLKTQTAVDFSSVLPKLSNAIGQVMSTLEVESLDKLTKAELKKLLTDLRTEQEVLIAAANQKLIKNLKALSSYEADFEWRMLQTIANAAGQKIDLAALAAKDAWGAATSRPLNAAGQLLEPFIAGWGAKQVEGVNQAVMRAWGQGRTTGQLMRDIRGTKALNYNDGLVVVSRRQAEAVARTSVQQVAQSVRMETWQENDDLVEGYIFVATLDSKTTSQCRSLDGQEFELGKGPMPPLHINCRSTTIPKLPKEFDFLDKGATRSSKDGYVSAGQTYYDWLGNQSAAFQDEALGPTRAALFRDGGLDAQEFAALNLGTNFQPLTLEQMQAKEPLVFERAGITLSE